MSEEFSGEAAEFEIIDGNMHCKWKGSRPDLCIPLRVFRVNLARANKAVADYDARDAVVVPIRETGLRRPKRRAHAASD